MVRTTSVLRRLTITLALTCLMISSSITTSQAGSINDTDLYGTGLTARPLTIEKSGPVVSAPAQRFLSQRSDEQAVIWVMFTDKGVRSQSEFDQAAAGVVINEHAAKRRSNVDATQVRFADLPVLGDYVQQIIDLGGNNRTVSRWLNAASFEVPADKIDVISRLPFVASIRPVSYFTKTYDEGDSKQLPDATALGIEALNYGPSVNQITQISVDKAHAAGYNGAGVVLAILDTGFRKSHEAFAKAYLDGRVIDEYDFIFDDANVANEAEDASTQMSHGTSVWGAAGGESDGNIYGPAYGASFLLAKTEDIRSETPIEEDFWVAAMEWSDSLGADVITTSLGYSDWYTYADFDGQTAIITLAADSAISLGIVVVNSAGNGGPGGGTITAPADAFNIISCGAVDVLDNIASFSSRGPTFDGRLKPEVCARGASTWVTYYSSDNSYLSRNGTSFSAPLVAGAVCILLQAHPNYTPQMIRQALMETADNSSTPNNTYGWGIIDIDAAIKWGVNFAADQTTGEPPLAVQFTDISGLTPSTWHWQFGDGNESFDQHPAHLYDTAGIYDVSLTAMTSFGEFTINNEKMIIVSADTLSFGSDSAYAGHTLISSIALSNSLPLDTLEVTFTTDNTELNLTLDSVGAGSRTVGLAGLTISYSGQTSWVVMLTADQGPETSILAAGSGEVLRLYFSTGDWDEDQVAVTIDNDNGQPLSTNYRSSSIVQFPQIVTGSLRTRDIVRGDFDNNGKRNLADITNLIAAVYMDGPPPVALPAGDCAISLSLNLADITKLISFVYLLGEDPDLQ